MSPLATVLTSAGAGACALALLSAGPALATTSSHQLSPTTRFALHQPDPAALQQVGQLLRAHNLSGAAAIAGELATPQATWLTKGTPAAGAQQVRQTVTSTTRCTRCRPSSSTTCPAATARSTPPAAPAATPRTRPGSTASSRASATARRSSSSSPTAWPTCPATAQPPTPARTSPR